MPSSCPWIPVHAFQPRRYRPGNIGNWSGHLPFAHDLIAAVHPHCFVELGTHLGESYFGFCQAIAENGVPCTAYAVDTWLGEEHAGFYSKSVYEEVSDYNQANYASFSYLLRSLFDDALHNFTDNSIDILHIDGLHTFEAVSHDFYSWLPKVKPGGIVLLHDVCARHLDFGVWKLWDKLKEEGQTFAFHHSWGLGVFRKPGSDAPESELLKCLFEGTPEGQEQIRRYYSLLATELEWTHRAELGYEKNNPAEDLPLQVYAPSSDGYQEAHSWTATVKQNRWQCVSLDILEGISGGDLRLDPADRPAIIELRGIALVSAVDQTPVWSINGLDIASLRVGGTLMSIGSTEANGVCRFFSYGNDPQLYLPSAEAAQLDQPLTIRIWLRLQSDLSALLPGIDGSAKADAPAKGPEVSPEFLENLNNLNAQLNNLNTEVHALKHQLEQEQDALKASATQLEACRMELENSKRVAESYQVELENSKRACEQLEQDVNKKQTRLYLLEDLRQELKQENTELLERYITLEKSDLELKAAFAALEKDHSELQESYKSLRQEHQTIETTLTNVLRSRSWRVTAPLRSVTEAFKDRSSSRSSS